MKKFYLYCICFSSPIWLMLITYIIIDPFKIIYHYDNYYVVGDKAPINRSLVSTKNYINRNETYHYDSFIFGNSRSMFYMIDDWKKHLEEKGNCYHFSESGGSVLGVYYKVNYIAEHGGRIANALFIIDYELLSTTEQTGARAGIPPVFTGLLKSFNFFKDNLINWFDLRFLTKLMHYHLTRQYTSDMNDYLMEGSNYPYYNPITNEEPRHIQDSLIAIGKYFSDKTISNFDNVQHPDSISPKAINSKRTKILTKLKKILDDQKTNYKIVISPQYDQIKINPKDLTILRSIFGNENVYDFSGVNKWTNDYHNYYEPSHYLPKVAADIMDSIYEIK